MADKKETKSDQAVLKEIDHWFAESLYKTMKSEIEGKFKDTAGVAQLINRARDTSFGQAISAVRLYK